MRFYAVRHKASGLLLPRKVPGRKQTYREPNDTEPPALFIYRGAAGNSLSWYCSGQTYTTPDQDGDPIFHTVPGTQRNKTDYEVVAVTLTIEEIKSNATVEAKPTESVG